MIREEDVLLAFISTEGKPEWGGETCSSEEGCVMQLERRGLVIQLLSDTNREKGGVLRQ